MKPDVTPKPNPLTVEQLATKLRAAEKVIDNKIKEVIDSLEADTGFDVEDLSLQIHTVHQIGHIGPRVKSVRSKVHLVTGL